MTGTFVSVDVAGFTPLSERLARHGRRGAEVLSDSMDRVFTALIDAFQPYGGDVLFFGGDALFVAFSGEGHAERAVDGAVAIRGALRQVLPIRTPLGAVRITVSVGAASGDAELVVGDGPQRPLFLVGPTVTRTLAMESAAHAGQVLVDGATANVLPAAAARLVNGDGVLVTRRRPRPPDGCDVTSVPLRRSNDPSLHVPDGLRTRLLHGDAPSEHRYVTVAFVVLRELDALGPPERTEIVQRTSVIVGEACRDFGVCWMHPDVIANGAKIILASGVPVQQDDDELRMIAATRQVIESDMAGHLAIGVHRGTAFVGEFGHPHRRTYSVNGDTTITAARLTSAAGPGELLATADVVERLGNRYERGPLLSIKAKGKREPLRAHLMGAVATGRAERPPVPLFGRQDELELLRARLHQHRSGIGSVTELVGDPGSGKTELIRSALAGASETVLRVNGELSLGPIPFAALRLPLRTALAAHDESALRERAGELAPLLGPVLGLFLPQTDASHEIEPSSILEQRAELITELLQSATAPGMVVVDDSHWLDLASVELIGALSGRLAGAGWMVVLTRRPDALPFAALGDPIVLEPLGDRDVWQLAIAATEDHPLSDALLDAVVARAGGNALFASQLARTASVAGDVGLPESAERVVGTRIDLLPPTLRTRLRRASVLGDRVDLDLLATITGDPDVRSAVSWDGLEEFIRLQDQYAEFRRDLYRLAAYEGLTFQERTRLHRAAADALAHRPSTPPAVLVAHARHADRPADVVKWAGRAADDAEHQAAFMDAAQLRALAAANARAAHLAQVDQAQLHVLAAQAHELLSDNEPAEQHYRQALRLAPASARTLIRMQLARLAFRKDELARARRRVAAAFRHLSNDDPEASVRRAELLILRASIRGLAGDRAGSDADARAALEQATRRGRDGLRGEALMQLALNADLSDDDDFDELWAEAIPMLERSGRIRDIAVLHHDRGSTHMVRGRWPQALASFEAAAEGFRRCGYVVGIFVTDFNRGGLLLEQGHPAEALDVFEAVVRRARAAGNERSVLFARCSVERARAWLGTPSEASQPLADCIRALNALDHRIEADDAEAHLVEALVLAGRHDEALQRAGPLLVRLAERDGEVVYLTVRRLAALAAHLSGRPGGLAELEAVLADAREDECGIEIARSLQALEALAPEVDLGWAEERERWCAELGVVWMPPVTFASGDLGGVSPESEAVATQMDE